MPDEQPFIAPPADRDDVANRVVRSQVTHDTVLDVAVFLRRRNHYAVFGAVVRFAVLDHKVAAADENQGGPRLLRNGVVIAFKNEISNLNAFGQYFEYWRSTDVSLEFCIEANQR